MTYPQFTAQWNGKHLEFNHDGIQFQCMDELYQYLQDVSRVDVKKYQGKGSAINLWNAANAGLIKGFSSEFTVIKNSPNNVPKQGDIVFWGLYLGTTGWNGHVAIYDKGNVYTFSSFDQNYPTGSVCHFQGHNYNGVKGWWRRK